jgi:uncharacterized cupin superfamily protein
MTAPQQVNERTGDGRVSKPVASLTTLEKRTIGRGRNFAAKAARVGSAIGMKQLGAQYMVVPPGKAAGPRHSHRANEELYVIFDGTGTYRCGDEIYEVKAGDVLSALAGDASTAHQLRNTGTTDLRYLVISTKHDPDICEYPDSGKYMVAAGFPPGLGMLQADFRLIGREKPALDYWDGEDIGEEEK